MSEMTPQEQLTLEYVRRIADGRCIRGLMGKDRLLLHPVLRTAFERLAEIHAESERLAKLQRHQIRLDHILNSKEMARIFRDAAHQLSAKVSQKAQEETP